MADFDVVIVGAGIAGGLAADSLQRAGLKVIVLEAGPNQQARGPLMKRFYAYGDSGVRIASVGRLPEDPAIEEAELQEKRLVWELKR